MPAKSYVTLPCDYCGRPIRVRPFELRRFQYHYCNRTCQGAHRARATGAIRVPNGTVRTGVTRVCPTCGVSFYRPPSQAHYQTCSNACSGPVRAETHRGKVVSDETRARMRASSRKRWGPPRAAPRGRDYGPDWRRQAAAARARDGHTCQDCGLHQTHPALDVHHLRPLADFAGDTAAANVLDNLISLCTPCHMRREAGRLPVVARLLRPQGDPSRWVTAGEACRILRLTPRMLNIRVRDGRIPGVKLKRAWWYFDRAVLTALVEAAHVQLPLPLP